MAETKLKLEVNPEMVDKTVKFSVGASEILLTPPIGKDYWMFRVKVGRKQAVIGFPKFSTIGVGFAQEQDWNTNLPYTCDAERIFSHIKHNKGRIKASDADCLDAIRLIQSAAVQYRALAKAVPHV